MRKWRRTTRISTRRASPPSWAAGCASRARTARSASASAATRACRPQRVVRDRLRPRPAAARPAPAGGRWATAPPAASCVDPRPLPDPDDAATLVLERYLGAFGPASQRDVAAWAAWPARLRQAWERLNTVAYRDGGHGAVRPARPAAAARLHAAAGALLARWDQALLAHADRDRIIPPELRAAEAHAERRPDGHRRRPRGRQLAARARRPGGCRSGSQPHVEIRRSAPRARCVRRRHARLSFAEPDAEQIEVSRV